MNKFHFGEPSHASRMSLTLRLYNKERTLNETQKRKIHDPKIQIMDKFQLQWRKFKNFLSRVYLIISVRKTYAVLLYR